MTRHRRIGLDAVREVLREVAAAHPQRVDPRVRRGLAPRYCEHGQPACLVAVVLARLGWTPRQLRQLDREDLTPSAGSVGGIQLAGSRHPLVRRIDPIALRMLDEVQRQQDRGGWFTWSRVVAAVLQEDDHGRYQRASGRVTPWIQPAPSIGPHESS